MSDSIILRAIESILDGSDEEARTASNRRRAKRHQAAKPVVVIPVLPDGSLDWEARQTGASVDVSEGGIGIEIDQTGTLPSSLLVGVEDDDGETHFAAVQVRYTKPGDARKMFLGTAFGGAADDFLRHGTLTPELSSATFSLQHTLPPEMLDQWVRAGALTKTVSDQILVCPHCSSLPTFRNGCRKCGSARVTQDELIHHYACAHVDRSLAFQKEGGLVCPKCHVQKLIVGADFEYLSGQFCCSDCQWEDATLESIAHCLRCNYRFAAAEAAVQEVFVYSANRLKWQQMIESGYVE